MGNNTPMIHVGATREGDVTLPYTRFAFYMVLGQMPEEGIPGEVFRGRECELADCFPDASANEQFVLLLSHHPVGVPSIMVDLEAVDRDALRFTWFSDGQVIHRGPIPDTAIVERLAPAIAS